MYFASMYCIIYLLCVYGLEAFVQIDFFFSAILVNKYDNKHMPQIFLHNMYLVIPK